MSLALTLLLATSQVKTLTFGEAFEFWINIARAKEVKIGEGEAIERAL